MFRTASPARRATRTAWWRRLLPTSRRERAPGRVPRFGRPQLEQLEDRLAPSCSTGTTPANYVVLGPLWFVSNTPFTQSQGDYQQKGTTVEVGFAPTMQEAFLPLLDINLDPPNSAFQGTLTLSPANGGHLTFDIAAFTVVVQPGTPLPLWETSGSMGDVTLSVAQLTSANGAGLDSSLSTPITAHGVTATITNLGLNNPGGGCTDDAQVLLQGTATFSQYGNINLSGLTANINGGNYLIADSSGLTLTGLSATLANPSPLSLSGIAAASVSGTVGYSHTDTGDAYTFALAATISCQDLQSVQVQIGLDLSVPSGGSGTIEKLVVGVAGQVQLDSVKIASNTSNPLTMTYDPGQDLWGVTGDVTLTLPNNNNPLANSNTLDANLGYANNPMDPGLVIQHGQLTTLNATVNGNFTLGPANFTTNNNGLTFSYSEQAHQFQMYGSLTLNITTNGGQVQSITADLGTSMQPGLVFLTTDDTITQINMALTGTFDLHGVTLTLQGAGMSYASDSQGTYYSVFGTVSLQKIFNASVSLGTGANPGLQIRNGEWQLDQITLHVQNVPLGPFSLRTLDVSYTSTSRDNYSVGVQLQVGMPGGWVVGGSLGLVNNQVTEISLSLQTGQTPIAIPGTGVSITYLSATLNNITDWANWSFSGQVDLIYGPQTTIFGQQVTLLAAAGSFTVDKDELVLSATVWLGASSTGGTGLNAYQGNLGSAQRTITLDWGSQVYSADLSASLVGGVFTVGLSFTFDGQGDVTIKGSANVNVPSQVPFIGGDTLGGIDFALEYRPNNGDPEGFVAAWVEVNVFGTHDVGFEYDLTTKDFKGLGTSSIKELSASLGNPPPKVYSYVQTFDVPTGATIATLSVSWPSGVANPTVSVEPDNDGFLNSNQFAQNNIVQLTQAPFNAPSSETLDVYGSTTQADQPLSAASYTLQLTTTTQLDLSQVTFTSSFSYPKPTILINTQPPGLATGGPTVSVSMKGTVDQAFASVGTVNFYLDYEDDGGYDGVPVAGAQDLPLQPAGSGTYTVTAPVNLSGLLPLPYYVYAVINDGTNTPVYSAYSNGTEPVPPVKGTVTDAVTNQNLSGVQVYLDQNNNGQLDPGEPTQVTDSTGFYAFWQPDVPVNQKFGVGVVVPNSYQFDTQNGSVANPTDGLLYDGTNGLNADFALGRLPAITGTVFNDTSQSGVFDPGETPVSCVVVYLDTNNDGRYELGEPTTTTDANGNYTFVPLNPNASYTVGLAQPGPAAYYSFDNVSGTTVPDTAGGGVTPNGILVGGAQVGTPASFGIESRPYSSASNQVLQLNGTSQFVDVPASPTLEPGTGPFSVSAWIRVNDTTRLQDIAGSLDWQSGAFDGWTFRISENAVNGITGNQLLFVQLNQQGTSVQQGTNQQRYLFGNTPLQDNTWYHVAFTYDGTDAPDALRLYVNGVLDAVSTNAGTLPGAPDIGTAAATDFNIGNPGGDAANVVFGGYLDDVAVWDAALRPAQVMSLALGAAAPTEETVLIGNPNLFQTGSTDTVTVTTPANANGWVAQVPTVNLGVLPYASVSGTVNSQALLNGSLGPTTTPLAGWTVNLLQNGQVVAASLTAADGTYQFPGVVPGSYTVQEVVPSGWREVTPFQSNLQLQDNGLVSTGTQPNALAAADFNGDGNIDVALTDPGADDVTLLYGTGGGQFGSPVQVPISFSDAIDVVAVNQNSNGLPNLEVLSASGYIDELLNNGDGTFNLWMHSGILPTGWVPQDIVAGDFNGDGADDVAVSCLTGYDSTTQQYTGGELVIFVTNGPSYNISLDNVIPGLPGHLAVGDFNGDGHLDLAISQNQRVNGAGFLATAFGDGTGIFPNITYIAGYGVGETPVAVADLNGDGLPDIATGSPTYYGYGGHVTYNLNGGGGTFPDSLQNFLNLTSPAVVALVLADLDGDFRPELVAVQQGAQGPVNVGLNQGTQIALNPLTFPVGTTAASFSDMIAVDVNNDGRLDLLLADPGRGGLAVLLNQSTITAPPGLGVSVTAGQAAAGVNFANVQTDPTTGTDVIDALYRDLLGRPADATGRAAWGAMLGAGKTPAEVALGIEGSVEYRTHLVHSLYHQLFGRAADAVGLQAWLDYLAGGGTVGGLRAGLLGSVEYGTLHGGTDDGFLSGLYADVFHRDLDATGRAAWGGLLAAGAARGDVAAGLFASEEFQAGLVRSYYQDHLGRQSDAGGQAAWVQALRAGSSEEQVLAEFMGSKEFVKASVPGHAQRFMPPR
jgi:hypothetical protein